MTATCSPRPDLNPAPLLRLITAYWESQTLFTASRIGLFEALAPGPLSLEAVAAALNTQPRPTRLLLKACIGLGLVTEDAQGFRNSPLGQVFLTPGTEAYLGNAIRYSDNLYETWGRLEQALREDRPPLAQETYLGADPEKTRQFVYGMHNRALGIGRALVTLVDLSGRRRLLDIGGGPGTYSALLTAQFPGLQAQVLDLPEVVAIAREIVAGMGAAERVSWLPGDYLKTAFPGGNDVVLISGVLHRETEATCRELIERAKASLEPGGLLILSDVFTDAGGGTPAFAALFGLNMLLTAPHGGVHADADVAAWLTAAGCQDITIRPFPPPLPHRVVRGVV
jgi:predicted O-methyltransferase YrrM